MADQKGTGRHPHKDSGEPYPHHKQETKETSGRQERGREQQGSERQSGSEPDDLKQREYRDSSGNIHHHTRTSEAMREEGKSESEDRDEAA
jgi:hypothetical protein